MRSDHLLITVLMLGGVVAADEPDDRTSQVAQTKGLIAFWDFSLTQDGVWSSCYDEDVVDRGYPVVLRRIGDPKAYKPDEWPYDDERSKLTFDNSGPFGNAVRRPYQANRLGAGTSVADHGYSTYAVFVWPTDGLRSYGAALRPRSGLQ